MPACLMFFFPATVLHIDVYLFYETGIRYNCTASLGETTNLFNFTNSTHGAGERNGPLRHNTILLKFVQCRSDENY